MTVQEMYQEMIEQSLDDLLLGYDDQLTYDDSAAVIVEMDFTTQS